MTDNQNKVREEALEAIADAFVPKFLAERVGNDCKKKDGGDFLDMAAQGIEQAYELGGEDLSPNIAKDAACSAAKRNSGHMI